MKLCTGFYGERGKLGITFQGAGSMGYKKTKEHGAKESNLASMEQRILGIVSNHVT